MPNPPQEFESFCVGVDVAMYRDGPKYAQKDFDQFIDSSIEYGLQWYDQSSLLRLKDFLDATLSEENPGSIFQRLWQDARSRAVFFDGPDVSSAKPGIVYFFERVREHIARKIGGS